jgi:cytidyltransferase-like protein
MDYIEYFADKIIHYGEELENDINQPFVGKTIYVSGYFDLFHIGHLRFLEAASKLGDNLIVGVYGDEEGEETNFFDGNENGKIILEIISNFLKRVTIAKD